MDLFKSAVEVKQLSEGVTNLKKELRDNLLKKFVNLPYEVKEVEADYDLSEKDRVKVTIYGKILDEKYSQVLFEKTDLSLQEVMLLDRVQKNIPISKEQSDILRKDNLIEGRYPNIYVSKQISEIVDDKVSYTKKSGFNDQYYKDLVLKYINDFGSITKKDLDELLISKLPDYLNREQKKTKIKYLVNVCLQKKEEKIKNIGTTRYPIWAKR